MAQPVYGTGLAGTIGMLGGMFRGQAEADRLRRVYEQQDIERQFRGRQEQFQREKFDWGKYLEERRLGMREAEAAEARRRYEEMAYMPGEGGERVPVSIWDRLERQRRWEAEQQFKREQVGLRGAPGKYRSESERIQAKIKLQTMIGTIGTEGGPEPGDLYALIDEEVRMRGMSPKAAAMLKRSIVERLRVLTEPKEIERRKREAKAKRPSAFGRRLEELFPPVTFEERIQEQLEEQEKRKQSPLQMRPEYSRLWGSSF